MARPTFAGSTHDAGGMVTHHPALRAFMGACFPVFVLAVFFAGLRPAAAQTTTPYGTQIRNVASVVYSDAGRPVTVMSNAVTVAVAPPPTASTTMILRAAPSSGIEQTAGPTMCRSGGNYVALPPPVL